MTFLDRWLRVDNSDCGRGEGGGSGPARK
uniref:Uncharacterized protein n=1 Tax=Rhizophora mucronata TaxID=61149 RepID=A0A2P2PRK2_RHIMU